MTAQRMMTLTLPEVALFVVALTVAPIHRRGVATTRPSPQPPIVRIVAREYAFDAPDSIDAGPTTFRLESRGREEHFVQLIRIASPHSFADFKRTLRTAGKTSWSTKVGGVGTIGAGGVAMTTIDLGPGLYALVCDMQDAKGTPHMLEGMLRALTVGRHRNGAAMPKSDVALTLTDYAFSLSAPLKSGDRMITVHNAGSQAHMALVWRLHPGKSAADVVHWLHTPFDSGPPPVTLEGGVPDLDSSRSAQLRMSLRPGRYLFICLVDDIPDHTPHYLLGMVREFIVTPGAEKAHSAPPGELPGVRANANTERAGVLHDGVLTLSLDAKRSTLRLDGPDHPPMTIEAFSEPGKPPLMPGPPVRTPAETEIRLSIRNSLSLPLTFFFPAAIRGGADRFTAVLGDYRIELIGTTQTAIVERTQ
jgi:hypothetical protein